MHYEVLRRELKHARNSGQPWHVLAGFLRRGLGVVDGERQPAIWKLASRETGLSEVMLRRYLLALERLEAIERENGQDAGTLLSGGLAPTEVALKIYRRNPAEGLKALRELKDRKITLRDMRVRLDRTDSDAAEGAAGRQTSMRDRGALVALCEGLVSEESGGLFGRGTVATRRPSARYFRRVGFEFRDADGTLVGGADLYLNESGGRDPLDSLAQSVVLAGHLPEFYVMLGIDMDRADAERASDALAVLGAEDIGVLLLRDDHLAVTVRRARIGTPSVEKSAKYADMLKAFATGRSPLRD